MVFQRPLFKPARSGGFSLLELVIVIVLLGILSVSLSSITRLSVSGYIDAKDRNQLSQSAKWVLERLTREVREALPQSVRTTTSGNLSCVEFMRIVNASSYLNLPANGSVSSFTAVGFDLSFSNNLLVAIMPINPLTTYAANGTLGNLASISVAGNQATIGLSGPTSFTRRSPQNRFYILETPVSFCLDNASGQINRYDSYGVNLIQAAPPAGGNSELFAENMSASGDVFSYQPGNLSRSGLLQINLRLQNRDRNLSGDSEAFEVYHEVHIRNVP